MVEPVNSLTEAQSKEILEEAEGEEEILAVALEKVKG